MRVGKTFLKYCFTFLIPICIRFTYGCIMYRFVPTDDGKALEGHVIKTVTKPFVSLCWSDCVWLPRCFSINVHQTSDGMFECELNNSSKKANPSKMASKEGWSYQEMKGLNKSDCKAYECKRKEDLGDGWIRFGESAIKLFTEKKDWTDARSHCQSLGGDLLSITSSNENDFVNDVFVENLNLTYLQEDKKINAPYRHFKLNGEESEVKLRGVQGDAKYILEDRERALYLNGKTGQAEIPSISADPGKFTLCFWIKPLEPFKNAFVFGFFKDAINILQLSFGTSTISRISLNVNTTQLPGVGLEIGVWYYPCLLWNKDKAKIFLGRNGTWVKQGDVTSIDTSNVTFRFGGPLPHNFHGFFKHLTLVNGATTKHEVQTMMYWHEQGVWIGLNNPEGSDDFSWSDGTPIGQFMNLPFYRPQPKNSKRKCVAMAKDKEWLDKHCDFKYPFLCEKPAPP